MPEGYILSSDPEAPPVDDKATERLKAKLSELVQPQVSAGSSPLLQFFDFEHLPPHLQAVSRPFGELAQHIVNTLPNNPERTVALRKLLEAKDCAVRALLFKEPPSAPF